jgi:hypothetical protein
MRDRRKAAAGSGKLVWLSDEVVADVGEDDVCRRRWNWDDVRQPA